MTDASGCQSMNLHNNCHLSILKTCTYVLWRLISLEKIYEILWPYLGSLYIRCEGSHYQCYLCCQISFNCVRSLIRIPSTFSWVRSINNYHLSIRLSEFTLSNLSNLSWIWHKLSFINFKGDFLQDFIQNKQKNEISKEHKTGFHACFLTVKCFLETSWRK